MVGRTRKLGRAPGLVDTEVADDVGNLGAARDIRNARQIKRIDRDERRPEPSRTDVGQGAALLLVFDGEGRREAAFP